MYRCHVPSFMLEHNIGCDSANRLGCWPSDWIMKAPPSQIQLVALQQTFKGPLCPFAMWKWKKVFSRQLISTYWISDQLAPQFWASQNLALTSIIFPFCTNYTVWYFVVGDQMDKDTELERGSIMLLNGRWAETGSKDKKHSFISPSIYRI